MFIVKQLQKVLCLHWIYTISVCTCYLTTVICYSTDSIVSFQMRESLFDGDAYQKWCRHNKNGGERCLSSTAYILGNLKRIYQNTSNVIKETIFFFFTKKHFSLSNAKDLRIFWLAVACWLNESKRYITATFQDVLMSNKIEAHLFAVQTVH